MNLIRRIFLTALLFGLLLAAGCGQQPASTNSAVPAANVDSLVVFDSQGYAVLRGRISGDRRCQGDGKTLNGSITIEVPVLVQGLEAGLEITYFLSYDTQIASTATPHTNMRDFLASNSDAMPSKAFAIFETVDITFTREAGQFNAVAIRRIEPSSATERVALDGIFSTNFLSKGVVEGSLRTSNWDGEFMEWTVGLPISIHGVESAVLLPFRSTNSTKVVTADGQVLPPTTPDTPSPDGISHPFGQVQLEFTRKGELLEANRFTQIP